jgi:hypothetical protein
VETLELSILYFVIEIYEKSSRMQLDRLLTNRETANRLNITPILGIVQDYRRKIIRHVNNAS